MLFSAKTLNVVGEGCFSKCSILSSINCSLRPEDFTCQAEDGQQCFECPVCYGDVEECLKRGKFGEQAQPVQVDEQTTDAALQRFKVNLTVQQALGAEEGQVIAGCLVLKGEEYEIEAFRGRQDFWSVLAPRLRHVSRCMFQDASNLRTVVMPSAVGVDDGDYTKSAFTGTRVENCYFPNLVKAGFGAFYDCKIKELNGQNFPALTVIAIGAF